MLDEIAITHDLATPALFLQTQVLVNPLGDLPLRLPASEAAALPGEESRSANLAILATEPSMC